MLNPSKSTLFFLANLVGFQLSWWGLVLFGDNAIAPVAILLVLHLFGVDYFEQVRRGRNAWLQEARLILMAGVLGFAVDSVLTLTGWFSFATPDLRHSSAGSALAPMWLLTLWLAFAATLNCGLGWFKSRYAVAVLAGGVLGPLSYIAAWKLQVVSFPHGLWPTSLVLVCIWCPLFPFLMFLTQVGRQREVNSEFAGVNND